MIVVGEVKEPVTLYREVEGFLTEPVQEWDDFGQGWNNAIFAILAILERRGFIVASDGESAAVLAERERCARVADGEADTTRSNIEPFSLGWYHAAITIAAAIRATPQPPVDRQG